MAKMDCVEVWHEISNYVDGVVSSELRQSMDQHFMECHECKSLLDGMRDLVKLAGDEHASNTPRGFSQLLRAKFDRYREIARDSGVLSKVPIGITDDLVELGSHLLYLWDNDAEFDRGIRFFYPGLGKGDHCILFGHNEVLEKAFHTLRKDEFDPEWLVHNLHLTVVPRCKSGYSSLSSMVDAVQTAISAGARTVRFLGCLGIGRNPMPDTAEDEIVDLECKVAGLVRHQPCVVVCMYDVRSLPGCMVVNGGLRTHDLTISAEGVRQNPYYMPERRQLHGLKRLQ